MKQQQTEGFSQKVLEKVKSDLERCIELLNSDIDALMHGDSDDVYVWFGLRELRDQVMDRLRYLDNKMREQERVEK